MVRWLAGLLLATAMLGGCGADEDDGADADAGAPPGAPAGATAFTVTSAGGTFAGEGALAGVTLEVPAGAVAAPVELWMAPPDTALPLPANGRMVGPEVVFGPAAPALAEAARLTLPFEPTRATMAGVDVAMVKVWRVGPDGWTIEDPAAPAEDGKVTTQTDTLTRFGAGVEVE